MASVFYVVSQKSSNYIRDFDGLDGVIAHVELLLDLDNGEIDLDEVQAALDKSGWWERDGIRVEECVDDQ